MVTRVEKIENHFLEKIASNELKPGDQLPTVKEIKTIFNVGHVTAANVLKSLSDKGDIKTVRGHGSFVSRRNDTVKKQQQKIVYACGHGISPELTSFYMRVYQGAKDNIAFAGYLLDFVTVDLVDSKKIDFKIADNSIAVISDNDDVLKQCIANKLDKKGVALVYCGMGTNILNVNSVVPDNYAGAVQAVKYLIECGHRCIAYVGVFDHGIDRCHSLRIQGWQDSMKKAGLDISEVMQWHISKHSEKLLNILKRIKAGDSDVPTAFLVANDAMAAEIINAALILGLSIPRDLSIIGFENHYQSTDPAITTMACSGADFGREAVCLVEKLQAYPNYQPIHVQLPMQLLERGSVRNIGEE